MGDFQFQGYLETTYFVGGHHLLIVYVAFKKSMMCDFLFWPFITWKCFASNELFSHSGSYTMHAICDNLVLCPLFITVSTILTGQPPPEDTDTGTHTLTHARIFFLSSYVSVLVLHHTQTLHRTVSL